MNSMMEFRDGRHDSNNHSMTKSETTLSESDLLTPSKKSGSSYSPSSPSSSSSGSSFDEDFFHLEGTKDNTSQTGTHKLGENTHLALTNGHDKEDIPIIVFSPKSQGSDLGSLGPASPRYVSSGLVKQSPPIQVMGRTDNFENSYRIPSSVFSRSKSTTPQEWSVASNESLFSIHVGNNSFSREQMAFLGKSGELVYPLTKSGELVYPPLNKSGELKSPDSKSSGELVYPHSGEFISYQTSAPQDSTVVKSDNNTLNLREELGVTEAAAETMKEVLRVTAEDRYKENAPTEAVRLSFSISPRSDESGTSVQSFAFPMCLIMWMRKPFMCCRRRKKCARPSCYCCARPSCHCCAWPSCRCCAWSSCRCCARPSCRCCARPSCHCCARPSCNCCAWPSCYCFNCRRAFCYCSWPSCSCCNGSWAFCYRSNCSRIFCCRSRTLTAGDRGKSSSAKTDPELQQLEQHTPSKDIPAAPNTLGSRWFSCFSCCHICKC
ncbi:uncharacterized protein LOC113280875 isoform X1 [Papaver somniferum]|uniref:uncharacterized protein LOC113280875 isoform X1 n=1 Tax=Papaver somniferum TaxID=3469 RepID=UPI000E6F70A6|nr:uncharacterized protein LOC113280875 isoform X1 [Papaver somniferum]XP_026385246.1 uncharacterized protein LOC113280875 isoform X1 [Papaver somniferum]